MIVLYTGRRGKGKTLSMVKDAKNYYDDGKDIYSNIELKFATYVENDWILDIGKTDLHDIVLVIDEIQTLVDSRRSARKGNVDFSYFIQQIRKRNIIILCTTQFSGTVDLRLRQHIDIIARPSIDKDLNVCQVTYIDLTSMNDNFIGITEENDIEPNIVKVTYDALPVYDLYDTNKIIKTKEKEKTKKEVNPS